MLDYQSLLNDEQREVVLNATGPSLVLAGAGSGKTRTLIFKLVRLLEEGVSADSILLVTFTNKAAREMISRAEGLLKKIPAGLAAGTFHSLSNRFLRKFAPKIGFTHQFTILDEGDAESLLTQVIRPALDLNKKLPKAAGVKEVLSFAKNSMGDVETTLRNQFPFWLKFKNYIVKAGEDYEALKKKSNAMDFDDLLFYWLKLLEHPGIRTWFQKQYRHILVDEYQDTNRLQGEIVKLLGERAKTLVAVGDDAQSIYSFRAADINNILEFPQTFPNTKIYKLETNYRSQQHILDVANIVIAQNENQYEKNLKSSRGPVAKPILTKLVDRDQQAQYIVNNISEITENGHEPHEIAILVRSSYDTLEIELELSKRGFAYLKRGGIRYFEQAHIKDALAFLKVWSNPHEYISWIRILKMLAGFGDKTAGIIAEVALKDGELDLADPRGVEKLKSYSRFLSEKANKEFQTLIAIFESFLQEPSIAGKLSNAVKHLYDDYAKSVFTDADERLEDIEALGLYAGKYKSLEQFLSDISLSESFKGEKDDGKGKIILSTIHQAKGLEWGAVFVPSLVEGKFPHARSSDDEAQLEEERRLFYVAVTRAKDLLYLLYPLTTFSVSSGNTFHKPSRFLKEIPNHLVTKIDSSSTFEEKSVDLNSEPSVLGKIMKMRR